MQMLQRNMNNMHARIGENGIWQMYTYDEKLADVDAVSRFKEQYSKPGKPVARSKVTKFLADR